jgi:hypothetical protein
MKTNIKVTGIVDFDIIQEGVIVDHITLKNTVSDYAFNCVSSALSGTLVESITSIGFGAYNGAKSGMYNPVSRIEIADSSMISHTLTNPILSPSVISNVDESLILSWELKGADFLAVSPRTSDFLKEFALLGNLGGMFSRLLYSDVSSMGLEMKSNINLSGSWTISFHN